MTFQVRKRWEWEYSIRGRDGGWSANIVCFIYLEDVKFWSTNQDKNSYRSVTTQKLFNQATKLISLSSDETDAFRKKSYDV